MDPAIKKKAQTYLWVMLLVTFVLYLPSLKSSFVNNDDPPHLLNNPSVRSLDLPHLKQMFTSTNGIPVYIPLTFVSFAVEYKLFKYNPFFYHFDNLLLHLGITALIFYFGLQIGLSLRTAFIAGLLFGIHPMHVESVAWVTERKDLLYSFFYMLALCFYWRYLSEKKIKFYAISVICGLLSVLAKPMALSLPLVLVLCDWYKGRRFDKNMILDKIPVLLCIIPVALITYMMNARNPVQHGGEAVLLWIWCFVFYFQKFFWPTDLIIFNKFPQPFSLTTPEFALSVLAFVILLAALWRFRKQKLFLFAVLFYFFSVFFLLRFDDLKYLPPVSNRYMYLPSMGLCFLLGFGIDRLLVKKKAYKKPVAAVLIGIAVLLGGMTIHQFKFWQNSISHWSHELKYDPDNAMALVNRGEAYKEAQKFDLAFADFNRAAEKDPEYPEGFNSRGQMYGMSSQIDLGIQDFKKAVELKPNFDEAYNNLGVAYSMKGELDQAIPYYQKALELDPGNIEAHYNLGENYYQKKEFDLAFKHFQKVLLIDPNSSVAYNRRGLIYGIKGQFDLALKDLNTALLLDPKNPEFSRNRAKILELKKRTKR